MDDVTYKYASKTMDKKETFFGFKKVAMADKAKMVGGVFSSVASRYDLMNNVMSFGIHHFWKDQFCELVPHHAEHILDVAGGTGDIAMRCLKKSDKKRHVTICDINHEMLIEGKNKAIDRGILSGLDYIQGDAEKLPFADNSFDCYTIAFGIRNVTDIDAALLDSYRVLKPGGKFLCLEFSKVNSSIIQKIYDLYSFKVIPKVGELIAGDEGAYRYLSESIRQFPEQDKFTQMIKKAGYKNVSYRNLNCGIVAIHMGYK